MRRGRRRVAVLVLFLAGLALGWIGMGRAFPGTPAYGRTPVPWGGSAPDTVLPRPTFVPYPTPTPVPTLPLPAAPTATPYP